MKKFVKFILWVFGSGVTLCLFAGMIAFLGFVLALCIGGDIGADISLFIGEKYFPCVIRITSVLVFLGLVGMYCRNSSAFK